MTKPEVIRRRRLRRKRRRAIKRAVCMAVLLTGIVAVLRMAGNHLLPTNSIAKPESAHLQAASAVTVSRPVERHSSLITDDLKNYSKAGKTAAKIYKNRNQYSETLLAAYLNNPEMEEFIDGYLDADLPQYSAQGGLTRQELGLSGCGPTCLSMVLVSLTGSSDMTPAEVARFSEENGYYVEGSGTSWSLMTDGASALGLSARELSLDESVMKSSLDSGHPIICSMGPGDFTTQGHFILIYGYDAEGFLVNDPNCISRSSRHWDFETLRGQIKNLWAYSAL